ncbi:MAG TPA: class I SAM-dependent methyltransferase [Acidimicrobiia bacterium]|nr:class I SAM-dependent methyltransferase [Acidimicrobiia bacterium]
MEADDPTRSVAAFYDGLADHYDALYEDWWAGAQAHGRVIDGVLHELDVRPPASILDCACGIGTQALGLAALGYRVTGTDLSAGAVERARREAGVHSVQATLLVGDMRELDRVVPGPFAAVVCCDNSLPHLVADSELDRALSAIRGMLAPGGPLVASVRDYDNLLTKRPTGVTPIVRARANVREIVGQAWEWHDGNRVHIDLFILREGAPDSWTAQVHSTWYRAYTRDELTTALTRAGLVDVRWWDAATTGYYQPIVTARAPQ